MAKEAETPEVNEQAKTEVIPRSPADSGAEMLENPEEAGKEKHDFGGLFSDEKRPTESELSGEAPKEAEKPSEKKDEGKEKPKSDTATPKPEGEKPQEEPKKKAEDEVKEKPKEELKKKDEKPPEGFVRKEALAETRAQVRLLKDEISKLKAELTAKPEERQPQQQAPEDAKWRDFKVLSDTDYDALVEDDPIEAQKYTYKLRQFERYQDQKAKAEQEAQQSKANFQRLVDNTVSKIKEAIPGIYDEDSNVASDLATFAVEYGFEDDAYLDAMTNPATLIVPPGQNKSYLLGPGAMALIKLLHNLRAKVSTDASDPAKLREDIQKEIEPKLREEITKELVAKFKGAGTGQFKSLTEVPGTGEKPESPNKALTEEDWGKLSDEERQKLLGA